MFTLFSLCLWTKISILKLIQCFYDSLGYFRLDVLGHGLVVMAAYNAYCVISVEGDDDTYDDKTAGSHSGEVGATVNYFLGTLFHMIITRTRVI